MARSTTCDARRGSGPWKTISVHSAIELGKQIEKRCVECHGRVRAHKASGSMEAHIEHMQRHVGCSLGDCYDGNGSRRHPLALA
jgi:hypothetical protein